MLGESNEDSVGATMAAGWEDDSGSVNELGEEDGTAGASRASADGEDIVSDWSHLPTLSRDISLRSDNSSVSDSAGMARKSGFGFGKWHVLLNIR